MSFTVHTFEINAPEKELSFAFHEKIGEGQDLYFLAKMSIDAQAPRDMAEEIFGAVYDYYQEHTEMPSYERFEKALKNANKEAEKWQSAWGGVPDIVVACFDINQLYLSQSGSAETYLIRGGTSTQISESSDSSKELFVNVLNGSVAIRDILVLSSDRLLRSISASHISQIFDRREFNSAVSLLRQELANCADESLLVTVLGVRAEEIVGQEPFLSKLKKKALSLKEKGSTATARTPRPGGNGEAMGKAKAFASELSTSPKKAGMVLLGLILLYFLWGLTQKQEVKVQVEDEQETRQQLTLADELIDQAKRFSGTGKNKEAKDSLEKASETLDQVFNDTSEDVVRLDVKRYQEQVSSILNEMEKAEFKTAEEVADLSKVTTNPVFDGIMAHNGNYYVYDQKKVAKAVPGAVTSAIPITQEDIIIEGQVDSDGKIVFLTNGPGVTEYQPGGNTTTMATNDEVWKGGIDIDTYGISRVYILAPRDNVIWKYNRSRTGYGAAEPYSEGADLSLAVSFTVGRDIFVISNDGRITKIASGVKQDYDFREKPTEPFVGNNLRIFTEASMKNIYILDPDQKRFLVFGKGDAVATYKKQIRYDTNEPIHNFVVNSEENKASLVSHSKIYEISFE